MFYERLWSSRGFRVRSAVAISVAVAVLGGGIYASQDKYAVRVPNGLAFADFRG